MTDEQTRRARLEPLLASARSLLDQANPRGQRARERLVASSGLSAEGVNFALSRCLESDPPEQEIAQLIRSTPTAQVAHVLLSANVFVAAHRAIAIGLAASETVRVRASRREPEMAELLLEGAPGAFQLVDELSPNAGDRLWAYGSDATLEEVSVTLPPGVAFHAHGSGFGVCVLDASVPSSELDSLLARLAEDVALFDQRGCLSPRVLLVEATPDLARELGRRLATELDELERRVPRGRLEPHEAADITAYRDSAVFAGEAHRAGLGVVSVGDSSSFPLPPIGRNVHVQATSDAQQTLLPLRPLITSCAFAGAAARRAALRAALPGARICDFGTMQTPPFDGPVDRRDL
ncbi:MAG TPA: acyl-CoA reductase [Polyangiaceae bacterium]